MTSIDVTITVFRKNGEIVSNRINLSLMRFQGSGIFFQSYLEFYVSLYNKFILNSETAYIELDNFKNTKPKVKK